VIGLFFERGFVVAGILGRRGHIDFKARAYSTCLIRYTWYK